MPQFLHEYQSRADSERTVLLGAHCPACDFEHSFRVDEKYWSREGKDVWYFNGDYERPTFYNSEKMKKLGSMLSQNPKRTRICHSYLENGLWRFLKDSTHDMAGQENVPMVPIKEG